MPKSPCGQHVELSSNDAVRVTRCGCGTLHLTLKASGVTVRLSADGAKGLTKGLITASERLELLDHQGSTTIN